jgi:hypothetical protein
MSRWRVKTTPVPENPSPEGKNESGVVVQLTDGAQTVEVSRVLFVRRNARNKSVGFKRQLLRELDKAYEAMEVLNDSYLDADEKTKEKLAAVEVAEKKREELLKKLQSEPTPRV